MRTCLLATLLALTLPATTLASPQLSERRAKHAISATEPGANISGCVRLSRLSVECRANARAGTMGLVEMSGEGGTEEWLLDAVLRHGRVRVGLGGERLQLRSG